VFLIFWLSYFILFLGHGIRRLLCFLAYFFFLENYYFFLLVFVFSFCFVFFANVSFLLNKLSLLFFDYYFVYLFSKIEDFDFYFDHLDIVEEYDFITDEDIFEEDNYF